MQLFLNKLIMLMNFSDFDSKPPASKPIKKLEAISTSYGHVKVVPKMVIYK